MFHPVGPLPPSVYWRRRALAGVGLVLAPALLISGVAAADDPAPAAALDSTSAATLSSPTTATRPSGLVTPPGGAADVLDPLAGSPSATAAARSTTPAVPAAPCEDGTLRVTARTDEPRYGGDGMPQLSLVVRNTGSTACRRDLDAARQSLAVVRRPGDGLWASNDCSPGRTDDVRTLAPGEEAVFSVAWSGRTSDPGCRGTRRDVPTGTYQLLARLDGILSAPTTFVLGS